MSEFKRYLGRYATEITGALAEHPLVICRTAPDNLNVSITLVISVFIWYHLKTEGVYYANC